MENTAYIPDPEEFDHVDDFVDGVSDHEDFEEEEVTDDKCGGGGCMPGPEEFD